VSVELGPVYLITGSDRPKVATALERLRRHFVPESIERVAAQEATGDDVVALCNAGSLFGGRRLVIVDDVDGRPNAEGQLRAAGKAADVDAVVAYLASPAPDAVLALVARGLRRDAPLAKACAKAGDVLAYDVPKGRLAAWVRERFKAQGVTADPDACAALMQLVGDDLHALAAEIDKITTWSAGEPVGAIEVERLVAASADTPVYAITDAWGRRDVGRALEAAEAALERSPRPVSAIVPMIAAQLARQVGIVRRARHLEEHGVRPKDAMKQLGVRHEFQAQRAFEFGRNFSDAELDAALVRVAELDHAIKGGSRVQPELELQRALVDITAGARRGG
jgi:DNA polymerase-3 subunit delta